MKVIKTQTINEKEKFKPIDLNGIASDPDHPVKSLKFEGFLHDSERTLERF